MIDLRQVKFSTAANTFKNTGVFDTSVTASGTVGAGATKEFTTTISLTENQVFCYAIAEYEDYGLLNGNQWQKIPTFDVELQTTPLGNIAWYLLFDINGTDVTFTLGLQNPYGGTETIPTTTINIRYVTYTLDQ